MPNRNYQAGRALEYKTAADLEANGYTIVCRAAGSHGRADVIAQKPGELLYVQCKADGKISPADRAALTAMAREVGAVPLVAYLAVTGPRGGRTVAYRLPSAGAAWTPDHALRGEA